jgi:hypothetical protein
MGYQIQNKGIYCTITEGCYITICDNEKEEHKMLQNPVEFFKNLPKKKCPDCGEVIEEQAESYFLECDYCLSKKAD